MLDWSLVRNHIIHFKNQNASMMKSIRKSVSDHIRSEDFHFALIFYEKESRDKNQCNLMNYIYDIDKTDEYNLSDQELNDFEPENLIQEGSSAEKQSVIRRRLKYEKIIIDQLKISNLTFKNIVNEFEFNFYPYLSKTKGIDNLIGLTVEFCNRFHEMCNEDMMVATYEQLKRVQEWNWPYFTNNLDLYLKMKTENPEFTDFDEEILIRNQDLVYKYFNNESPGQAESGNRIENGDFDNYVFPLFSTTKLKTLLKSKKLKNLSKIFVILVHRERSLAELRKDSDLVSQRYLVPELFNLYESGQIPNYSSLQDERFRTYFTIPDVEIIHFINQNKLISKDIFKFLIKFKKFIPRNLLNEIDVCDIDYLGVILKEWAGLEKPRGKFEMSTINMKYDKHSSTKSSKINTSLYSDKESLYFPKVLDYKPILSQFERKFNPFNYSIQVSNQIFEKLKVKSQFNAVLKGCNGHYISIYRELNNLPPNPLTTAKFDRYNQLSELFGAEINFDSILTNMDYLSNTIIIEQSLPFLLQRLEEFISKEDDLHGHLDKPIMRLINFSNELNLQIFNYLKENNLEFLKEIVNLFEVDLNGTTLLFNDYNNENKILFNLLRGVKIDVVDVKPYLHCGGLKFSELYGPLELIGLFERKNWVNAGDSENSSVGPLEESLSNIRVSDPKQKNSKQIDRSLERILLDYKDPLDQLIAIRYFKFKHVKNLPQKIADFLLQSDTENSKSENNIIYEYLREQMINGTSKLDYFILNTPDAHNSPMSDSVLFYETLKECPDLIEKFIEDLNPINCTLKESILAFSLNGQCDIAEGNIFYECISKEPYDLLSGIEYRNVFESDLFRYLSEIRPKDVHPLIPSISVLSQSLLEIHLRDQFFTFVHQKEISEFIQNFISPTSANPNQSVSDTVDSNKTELNTTEEYFNKIQIILNHAQRIDVSQLFLLYHHQNTKISKLAVEKLKTMKYKCPDMRKYSPLILQNVLIQNQKTSSTNRNFLDDMVFYHTLDKLSIQLFIELIKVVQDKRLISCLLKITDYYNLNYYLKEILNASDSVTSTKSVSDSVSVQ